jgi:hypothetical protein
MDDWWCCRCRESRALAGEVARLAMDDVQKLDISFDRLKNPFNAQILARRNPRGGRPAILYL